MPNAFSRDIRSIRAQENIGVHSGAPLLVEHFPEKSDPYLYGPIVAARLRATLQSSFVDQRAPADGPNAKSERATGQSACQGRPETPS